MKRRDLLKGALGAVGVAVVGCDSQGLKTGGGKGVSKCPVCSKTMPEGDYCAKCNAVATSSAPFKCPKKGKTVTPGTYCGKSNKFRFAASEPKCAKCGKPKGVWCDGCKRYSGLPKVSYCPKCKKPFDISKHKSCPNCS